MLQSFLQKSHSSGDEVSTVTRLRRVRLYFVGLIT
jgi:hypothetical protein